MRSSIDAIGVHAARHLPISVVYYVASTFSFSRETHFRLSWHASSNSFPSSVLPAGMGGGGGGGRALGGENRRLWPQSKHPGVLVVTRADAFCSLHPACYPVPPRPACCPTSSPSLAPCPPEPQCNPVGHIGISFTCHLATCLTLI